MVEKIFRKAKNKMLELERKRHDEVEKYQRGKKIEDVSREQALMVFDSLF